MRLGKVSLEMELSSGLAEPLSYRVLQGFMRFVKFTSLHGL